MRRARSVPQSLRVLWLGCTLAVRLCAGPLLLRAQEGLLPFETIELGIAVDHNVNETTFHEYWDPKLGIAASVRTPFYFGTMAVGLHVFTSAASRPDVPDFVSQYFHVAWGHSLDLPGNLNWYAGVRTGLMRMIFDVPDSGVKFEGEVAFEAETAIRYSPISRWHLILSGRYRKVYTHERINLSFIGIGLSRTFDTPQWLQELLR